METLMVMFIFPGYYNVLLAERQMEDYDAVLQRVLMERGKQTHQLSKEEVLVRKMLKEWDKLVDTEDVLCLTVSDADMEENGVLVSPSAMKTWLLEYLHDRVIQVIKEMRELLALLRRRWYWTGM
jgi:hypothetical protein